MTLFFNKKTNRFYYIEFVKCLLTTSRHEPFMLAYNYFATDKAIRVDDNNVNDFKPVATI